MGNFAVQRIDDIEAIYGGSFKRARASLGASAFGLQVVDLPPSTDGYPEHDHASDGQEEVYVPLSGTGEIEIAGERHEIGPGILARVGPGVSRKLWPGADGMRVLVIGGVPGKAYEPKPMTELGAPDPSLAQSSAG